MQNVICSTTLTLEATMRKTALALLMTISIVPAELCEDVFYLLLCTGNLVPEDLEESCLETVRRTQIYQFPDIGSQANGPKSGQTAHT